MEGEITVQVRQKRERERGGGRNHRAGETHESVTFLMSEKVRGHSPW